MAALLALGAWFVGIFVAYLLSQLFYEQAGTGFLERVSVNGWAEYFGGLYAAAGISHAAAVAAMVVMAWRGAR